MGVLFSAIVVVSEEEEVAEGTDKAGRGGQEDSVEGKSYGAEGPVRKKEAVLRSQPWYGVLWQRKEFQKGTESAKELVL